ncbi:MULTISPECIES: tetraacyldisaccharide 4'-kinase [Altibacter]|uniref:tetraacyldisaccharide 4'-kinase n=1 Tax=Altibacter TaxID=1535231 RepID=UPI000556DB09|nr:MULTISPECIES: tetraacyldisaccharide 4'-kinase [Altibacter]MCW9038714.1 tetraacyldisaccharide 4'-kinase [Altibacter sp.]
MKRFRFLLFPFSVFYGFVTGMRNYLYDRGWWESRLYKTPLVCVGNLSTGGTGKSPMIQYLLSFLLNDFTVAVLSRGYKRKTSGYLEVAMNSTVEEVGDEPLQIKQNFPNVTVAVCADRRTGVEKLEPSADVILLDDAFQHRKVRPSTSILLTSYSNLYLDDYLLPAGNLRESRLGAERADVILVTKCPEGVSYAKQQEIQFRMQLKPYQKLYFTRIGYDSFIYGKTETLSLEYLLDKPFTLVTGIANPKPLVDFLERKGYVFEHEKFSDHHDFSASEVKKLQKNDIILTTEKDYMRLQPKLQKFALYYLPIKTIFLNEQESFFQEFIRKQIRNTLKETP